MKILFMCVANSARSQLAEGLARKSFGPEVQIASAGSQPSQLNPYAKRVLADAGCDVSRLKSKSMHDLPEDFVENLDFVITLCAEEVCPYVPSKAKKLHWPLPDPAGHAGSESEQLARFQMTRDLIMERLQELHKELR